MICEGVREYAEKDPVEIIFDDELKRECFVARNEGGFNSTWIDCLDLAQWIKKHRPDLLEEK